MTITARDAQGRIAKGAGGRPLGARNKRPAIASALPSGAVATLYETLYQLALAGDVQAIRLLLDRLDPAPKGRLVAVPSTPEVVDAAGAVQAGRQVLTLMLAGEVSAEEASAALAAIARHIDTLEAAETARRLTVMEASVRRFEEENDWHGRPAASGWNVPISLAHDSGGG